MSRFLKRAAGSGIAFGILITFMRLLSVDSQVPISNVLLRGLVAGVVFGVIMATFGAVMARGFTRRGQVPAGEALVRQGPANHLRRWEGVGGWLYLTDQRLLFRPHRFNFKRVEHSIPLDDVRDVQRVRTWGLIPNGLHVITAAGTLRLVVEDRDAWLDAIGQVRRPARGGVEVQPT
jgi:hypothetical protein